MKVIFIMADSYRRDHIGAYGNKRIHTPNLDRLAATSSVFDHCYIGSFPTGPNRRDIHVGKGHAPGHAFNPWINIAPNEVTLAQRVSASGVHTSMITDCANGVVRDKNMHKGFQYYELNRGQEGDHYFADDTVPNEMGVDHQAIRYGANGHHNVLINRARRVFEDDYFAPRTYRMACEWIEKNYTRDDFFLWIETFDPHEPWDPPQYYTDRYDPGYKGRVIEFPPYGFYKRLGITDREIRHTQARYMGECTMVDHAFGRLMATLDKVGIADDVAIIFTADHGITAGYEGDAGCAGKPHFIDPDKGAWLVAGERPKRPVECFPLRTGISRIPLIVKMPGQKKGQRVKRIAQPWDMQPTVLDMFGKKTPDDLQGESLLPAIKGKKAKPRPYAFVGAIQPAMSKQMTPVNLRQAMNKDWMYSYWTTNDRDPMLVDLKNDPKQLKNVAKKNPSVCKRMHSALSRFDEAEFDGVKNPW